MSNEKPTGLTCIFCGKELSKSDAVRYRGAISCRECALAQEPFKDFKEKPFFLLASVGAIIGLFVVTMTVLHALIFAPMEMGFYVPPMMFYFSGIAIALVLQSFGIYALNRSYIYTASVVGVLVTVASALAQVLAIFDLIVDGPYYVIDSQVFAKGFGYFSYVTISYTLFSFAVGLGILLHIGRTRIDNVTVLTGAMFLLGGSLGSFSYIWPPVGFLHIIMYAVAFLFFFTKEELLEEEPIETLDYKVVKD